MLSSPELDSSSDESSTLPSNSSSCASILIAALFERQVKFPYEIAVDPAGILINTFPKKFYPWAEINNMLIKDDYITIDFKNNKLIQKQINEPVTETIKNEFNAFCAEHLAKNN